MHHELTGTEGWEKLKLEKDAVLVDVRTSREWEVIGVPDLSELDKEVLFVEWQMFPDMRVNPDFVTQLDQRLKAAGATEDSPILFLCRSGARSKAAAGAMAAAGYTNTINVSDGFEGDADEHGERAHINGWQFSGLPWEKKS
jgi:rhodanese-related sulfurtransferase